MAFGTASDAGQNSGPAPGKGQHNIEQLFNAEHNISFGDPIFGTGRSGPPKVFSSDPFMSDDGDCRRCWVTSLPALPQGKCSGADRRTAEQVITLLLSNTLLAVYGLLEANFQQDSLVIYSNQIIYIPNRVLSILLTRARIVNV